MLPAEVLIADPSFEWMKLALPLVIQEDLATSRNLAPFFAKDQSGGYEGHATEILRTVLENRSGRFQVAATAADARTQANRRVIEIKTDAGAGIAAVANRLAKEIDPRAREFPTKSTEALKAFTFAAGTQDLLRRQQLLNEAVAADNRFGLAYIALAETTAIVAPQSLGATIAAGTAQHDGFAPLERARWNALTARYAHAPLPQQADAFAAVLTIAPNNVDALGTLGASRFLQGNSREGEQFLRRAMALSPANLNLPLQLANGYIESKRFDDAITVLQPLSDNPAAIPALAIATLLKGKTQEANAVFGKFTGLLPADNPSANFLRTQWAAISAQAIGASDLPVSSLTPGYSAFLNGNFAEAVRFWQNAVQRTGDTDLRARAMLAASLRSAGRSAEANKIPVMPFVPDLGDSGVAVAFHQMRQILKL